MSLETLEARDRAETATRLRIAAAELRVAAQPARSEVFTRCGPDARQLADDIDALLGEAVAP